MTEVFINHAAKSLYEKYGLSYYRADYLHQLIHWCAIKGMDAIQTLDWININHVSDIQEYTYICIEIGRHTPRQLKGQSEEVSNLFKNAFQNDSSLN